MKCLIASHFILEPNTRNQKRKAHHRGTAKCDCEIPCITHPEYKYRNGQWEEPGPNSSNVGSRTCQTRNLICQQTGRPKEEIRNEWFRTRGQGYGIDRFLAALTLAEAAEAEEEEDEDEDEERALASVTSFADCI